SLSIVQSLPSPRSMLPLPSTARAEVDELPIEGHERPRTPGRPPCAASAPPAEWARAIRSRGSRTGGPDRAGCRAAAGPGAPLARPAARAPGTGLAGGRGRGVLLRFVVRRREPLRGGAHLRPSGARGAEGDGHRGPHLARRDGPPGLRRPGRSRRGAVARGRGAGRGVARGAGRAPARLGRALRAPLAPEPPLRAQRPPFARGLDNPRAGARGRVPRATGRDPALWPRSPRRGPGPRDPGRRARDDEAVF